jgi:hypothetical protein
MKEYNYTIILKGKRTEVITPSVLLCLDVTLRAILTMRLWKI